MSDDILLKYWHMENLDITKIWFISKIEIGREIEVGLNKWLWWGNYKSNVGNLLTFINEVADDKKVSAMPQMSNYPGTV